MSEKVKSLPFAFLGLAVIWAADYRTGQEVSLSVFYLGPVILVAWYFGRGGGYVMSLTAAVAGLSVDLLGGTGDMSIFVPLWNCIARLLFYLVFTYLVARVRNLLETEKRLARVDSLTGLVNRRAFFEEAERFLALSRRKGLPTTVAYIDLDDFKAVNDTYGHNGGDRLLSAVAEALKKCTRQSDIVARMGGDEFCVLLPEAGKAEAEGFVAKAREFLGAQLNASTPPGSLSIGVVTFLQTPANTDEVVSAADAIMYRVKNAGKRGVRHEVWERSLGITRRQP
ncbi:MAG: GGDEF domain-containing protein [Candidatus Hydrogenedens sp.]|nr:GGDEF domain-containing protein [Candidatus Hydrogenedentota bacterium]NLF57194.1 GGDEF domain-containing protein [Candidatus Hydrogenedens sp.]